MRGLSQLHPYPETWLIFGYFGHYFWSQSMRKMAFIFGEVIFGVKFFKKNIPAPLPRAPLGLTSEQASKAFGLLCCLTVVSMGFAVLRKPKASASQLELFLSNDTPMPSNSHSHPHAFSGAFSTPSPLPNNHSKLYDPITDSTEYRHHLPRSTYA